jgi:hypothetical protein
MLRRARAVALAALIVLVPPVAAAPAAAAGGIGAHEQARSRPVVSPQRYLRDVRAATTSLNRFGSTLDQVDDITEFRGKLTPLRGLLTDFDAAVRRLARYRLANRTIEAQRGRLARAGPPLARTLSDFLDAVRDLDRRRVDELVPKVAAGLNRFATAARVP